MKNREAMRTMDAYGRYAGLGFQFVASMALLGLGGYWLDGKLGTHPWLLIVGIFLGAAGGFYSLLQAVPSGTTNQRRPPSGGGSDDT